MAKTIYEKIEEKGRLEALEIIEEAKNKAALYLEQEEHDALLKQEKQLESAKVRNEDLIKTNKTSSMQIARQKTLAVKKELIHETFLKALEELKNLDDNKLKEYVINKISDTKLIGDEVVKVNQKDYSRYQKLFGESLDEINKKFNYHLSLSKECVDISGGFIIINPSFDIDYSFDATIKMLEDELETFVAGILFKE